MKYNHRFDLIEDGKFYKIYFDGKTYARIDFFDHILRVAFYKKEDDLFPTFSVCPGESKLSKNGRPRLSVDGLKQIGQSENDHFFIDDVEIRLDLNDFRLNYYKNGQDFFHDRNLLSYNLDDEMGKGSYHYLSREKDEHIYGLGDKTGPINKNGNHYKLETFDAMGFNALSSDPLYKQIPFYICKNSIGSYGIYYDTYSNGEIDFGREHNNYYELYKYFKCDEENLVYYVIFGSIEEIIERFTFLTGKSFVPPEWSFKYCGSTMAYTDSDHPMMELRNFYDKCKEYHIDCGGFYLSSGYNQIGDKRCVFHWNKDKFPDPKSFAEEFREKGIEFLPNVKPAFLTTHPLYDYIKEKGWFLHYLNNEPYVFPFWGGMGSYLDFTNPDAFDFWTRCVKENLVDLGYESIWNDNNEYDIHDDDVYACGFNKPIKAKLIRPLFPLLMTLASHEALDENKRFMSVTRSCPAGFQRVAETWTGDNNTSFEDFRGNHKMAMTGALTGYAFIGQDIGGFAGEKPDKELFLRWIAYGVFTPRFTLHSWNDDGSSTMPWLYPELKDKVMQLFSLRQKFLPYIYSSAIEEVNNYHPLIYPLFIRYPEYDEESDFFFLGDSLVAAPIFDKGKNEIVAKLPRGKWFYRGKLIKNETVIKNRPGDLPVYFIKEGSIVPVCIDDKICFEVYAKEKGMTSFTYYYDDENHNIRSRIIKVKYKQDQIIVYGIKEKEGVKLFDPLKRKLIKCLTE